MDILYLTNSSLRVKKESRNKLFFDQYRFCIKVYMQDMSGLRYKTHESLRSYLERQMSLRKVNYGTNHWQWIRWHSPITETSINNCNLLLEKVLKLEHDYKCTISGDYAHFYTNTPEEFTSIMESPGVTVENVRRAEVDVPQGQMFFSKPPSHKLRTYFKTQKIEANDRDKLFKFLKNHKDIRLSPCMSEWITKFPHNTYIMNNFFIDYNQEGFLMMMQLVSNIKIKETFSLHSR